MTRSSDFAFFRLLARSSSLTDAARLLSMTPSSVSRRLKEIESRLGTELVLRSTRSMRLTPQGERYLQGAEVILRETERLETEIASRPLGRLRICASFGFGETSMAPVIAEYSRTNPAVRVDLTITDRPGSIIEDGFDIGIHLGALHDSRLRALKLMSNDRILCAAPVYFHANGLPEKPGDLALHQLIEIAEDDNTVGRWILTRRGTKETVTLAAVPDLRTNSGAAALEWCRSGLGILLRSRWHAYPSIAAGELVEVLPDWHMPADVYAYYAAKRPSPQVRAFLDALKERFMQARVRSGQNGFSASSQ